MTKTSTAKRTGKFAIVGILLALANFLIYTFLARVIFNTNELLWLDSIIAYLLATVLAYFAHSRITWKERHVTKRGVIMFFVWNGITAIIVSPLFTAIFHLITPLYEFIFNISSNFHLPFDYNFIESTGVFCLTTVVTMVLNYLFYDKLVFNDKYLDNLSLKLKNLKSKFKKPTKTQIIPLLLYLLPIIFFIISYFLITTSGEDIWQGANNFRTNPNINPINDAISAFNFNSRITDMYAWSVIDFFDYQFVFGPDIIFRLIDVVMAFFTFYLATYLILKRRPRLTLRDALIYCACFTSIIITPFGRPFYIEFSMIHNYLPLALVTLAIIIPYLNLVTKHEPSKHLKLLALGMFILGLYFGMAATITPLAFLLTIVVYLIVKHKTVKFNSLPLWFYSGIIGTIIGFLICWLAGSGVDHYTNTSTAATFDYLSINNIFSAPASAIPRLLWHELYNFGIVLIPLFALTIACLLFSTNRRQFFTKQFYYKTPKSLRSTALLTVVFIIIHILGASLIQAPPRLLIPAYLLGTIMIFRFFTPYINSKISAITTVFFTTVVIAFHTTFLILYHQTTAQILTEIKNSNSSAICIEPSRLSPPRIPIIDLSQANMLVDWGTPQIIYGKEITFCK